MILETKFWICIDQRKGSLDKTRIGVDPPATLRTIARELRKLLTEN
jgi:hypothetical protein